MSNGWFEPPANDRRTGRPRPRPNGQAPQPGQRQPPPRPRHWQPLIYRCAAPGCGKEYLTPEARQHHVYHSHGPGNPKRDRAYDIDTAIYLGMERSRGFRYWIGRLFGWL